MTTDPSSFSVPSEALTRHLHVDFHAVSFGTRVINATATLLVEMVGRGGSIRLDTRQLSITKVTAATITAQQAASPATKDFSCLSIIPFSFEQCKFSLGEHDKAFGSRLTVELPSKMNGAEYVVLRIAYETSASCSAAQWLEPKQTAGKKYPYFFTQCQAIHARSLVPCQDTPSVKVTYTATVTLDKPLKALMSALRDGQTESGDQVVFKFKQPTPIPTYLIALAIGDLTSRDIGPRSKVWSEPSRVEEGAFEFTDTEEFISSAEAIVSPYVWHAYDILLLPPSFPYGGMENPVTTYVTPTLIAGDKSLVDVVAHEISHSWAGNLVTNASWEHFWLNEGFCVYIERKILARIHGESTRQFKSILGWKHLEESIKLFGSDSPLTCLVVDLKGVDPDDAFSSVPYEKGYNMLYHLEKLLGGAEVFDPYLKAHFEHFAYKSITTDDWKAYLYTYFRKHSPEKIKILDSVDWNAWLHKPGMPPIPKMPFDTTLLDRCQSFANKWVEHCNDKPETFASLFPSSEYQALSTDQKIVLLDCLNEGPKLSKHALKYMWFTYNLNSTRNAEIKFAWFKVCLTCEFVEILQDVADFLCEQGRMKYIRPLYRALMKFEKGKQVAMDTFSKQRGLYHPIAAQMVEKDLEKARSGAK